jgi:hypothetical protein
LKSIYLIYILFFIAYGCSNEEKSMPNGDLDSSFIDSNGKNNSSLTGNNNLTALSVDTTFESRKNLLFADGWKEESIQNGNLPTCYNFVPKRGDVENSLDVYVGGGTDIALKLMDSKSGKCVRYVFINSGSSYSLRNIPEGNYYVKIAYGKNWISKLVDGNCTGQFLKNPMYKRGSESFDYHVIRKSTGYSIPSYQLKLDVISIDSEDSFSSTGISQDEFNQ